MGASYNSARLSVDAIAKAGAVIDFAESSRFNLPFSWIANRVGVSSSRKPQLLVASSPDFSDSDAVHIGCLTSLTSLNLAGTRITDNALHHVRHLTQLRELFLQGTEVTSQGIMILGSLTRLEVLNLAETNVDDRAMAILTQMPRLRWLSIEETDVSEKAIALIRSQKPSLYLVFLAKQDQHVLEELSALEPFWETNVDGRIQGIMIEAEAIDDELILKLCDLPELEKLSLSGTGGITDDALRQIAELSRLKELYLVGLEFPCQSLGHLCKLTRLKILDLRGSSITNAGIAFLEKLVNLRQLDIRDTHITCDGIDAVRSALLTCEVIV